MVKKAIVLAVSAGCLWGTSGYFVRELTGLGFSIMDIVASRMIIAGIAVFFIIMIKDKEMLKVKPRDLWCLIGAGLGGTFTFNIFYTVATNLLTLSLASILLCTMPIPVMIFSKFLFHEDITRRKIVALVLALTGCVLVSGIIENGASLSAKGVIFGILGSVGYALYNVFSRYAANKGYNSLTIIFYSFFSIAILSSVFADFGKIGSAIQARPGYMSVFLILHALFVAILPYLFYTMCLKHIDTGTASIMASSEPIAATVLGAFIYMEIPSVLNIIGIAIFIAALVLLNKPAKVERSI